MTFNSATNTVRKTGHTAVIITLLFLVFLLCIPSALAAAGSHDANGGVITNIEIVSYSQTGHWQGYYGLITSGTSPTHFNYFNNSDASVGTIRRLELGASVQEGDVILITSSSNAPVLSELQRGSISLIDAITGTGEDSGTNTFTNISDYTMPCTGNNVTNVPTAYTFVDGQSQYQDFKEGILKDDNNNTVFVVPVSSAPKQGFDNVSYYFQFMVPNNNTNPKNYYMYYVPSCTGGALQVNILSPENKTYVKLNGSSGGIDSTPIPITVYSNRTISVYNYSLDDATQISFINATTTINPDFGSHKITVYLWDTNGRSGTDTQYFKVSNPVINKCYPDRYFAVSNVSNVAFRINATGDLNKTLYINITAPNGSVSIFNLSNVSDVYYTPGSEGRYNVTFNANYSECTSYFWSLQNLLPMTIKVLEVNESNGIDGIQARARWYWPGTNDVINPVDYTEDFTGETTFNYTNATGVSNIFPDVEFSQYNASLVVRLNSLNLSTATNEFYHDRLETPSSGHLLTYGIHTTTEFESANLSINYSNTAYSNEDRLSLWKCDNWDYANATCLSSWVRRGDAAQNKDGDLFNITVTNFSGFSIREEVAGGGGGGGSSSGGTTTPTPTPPVPPTPTPMPTLTPTATPSAVYIPGTGVTIEGEESNTLLQWMVALLGFMLPASEEEYLEKCEGCHLGGSNYGWWILCWYWWVLLFAVLFLRIVIETYTIVYVKMFLAFKPDDIKRPVNLTIKIRDRKDLLSSYIREHFSENALELFAEYDGTRPLNAIKTVLVDGLNRLLQGKTLYNEQIFTQVTLQEDTRNLIEQKPRWKSERILLNRLLLDDAYPYEITTCRSKINEEFNEIFNDIIRSRLWIPVLLILLVPLIGVFGLIISPLNWVIAVLIGIVYLIYLFSNTVPDAILLLRLWYQKFKDYADHIIKKPL